jgi:hypothetical protein
LARPAIGTLNQDWATEATESTEEVFEGILRIRLPVDSPFYTICGDCSTEVKCFSGRDCGLLHLSIKAVDGGVGGSYRYRLSYVERLFRKLRFSDQAGVGVQWERGD